MSQLQRKPTKLDSLLDLFLTNNPSLVLSIDNIPGISTADEHEAIVVEAIVVDAKLRAQFTKSAPHKIYQWKKVQWDRVRADTTTFADQFCAEADGMSVDEQWDSIEKHLESVVRNHVPHKMSKTRSDQPWLSTELKRRCRRKQRMFNKWKKLKAKHKPCKEAREAYKKYHQETNHLLQRSRMRYINNILAEGLENNSQKPFWRYIKAQRTEPTGVSPLKEKGQVHSDPVKKATLLAQQFRSVFTVDDDTSADTFLHGPSYPPIPDIDFSEVGVKKLLKGVDPKKASGPDQIPCRLLHELHEELAPVFTQLFRSSYSSGTLPEV